MVGADARTTTLVLPALAERSEGRLVAVVAEDEGAAIAALGAAHGPARALGLDGLEPLLRSGAVDAVYLGGRAGARTEHALCAARLGVPLLCEAPLALTESDAERLVATCAGQDVRLAVVDDLALLPACRLLIGQVREGAVGVPRMVACSLDEGDGTAPPPASPAEALGRALGPLRACRALYGAEPREVVARSGPPWSSGALTLTFDDGALALVALSGARTGSSTCAVTGTDGAFAIEPAFLTTRDLDRERQGGGAPVGATAAARARLGDQIAQFEARRLHGATEPDALREALAEVRLLSALAASIEQGRVVPLLDDDPALRQLAARPAADRRA